MVLEVGAKPPIALVYFMRETWRGWILPFLPDPTGTGHGLVYMRLFAACGNDYVEFLAYLESVPLSALTRGRPDQAGRTNFDVRHANCRSTPEI